MGFLRKFGAPGENRTPTSGGNAILSRARLPVPPQEQPFFISNRCPECQEYLYKILFP